jgi:hypothetical protein
MIFQSRVHQRYQTIMTKNESNLRPEEFVAKFGGEPGTCRKRIFVWRDTKPFRVASNYHVLDIVKVLRKQRDGSFRRKSCPKAMKDYVDNMGDVDTANSCVPTTRETEKPKNGGSVFYTFSWRHVW